MTVPRRLGDFEVQRRIGAGGMAEVFLATKRGAKGTEKRLVVKRLLPEQARSERLRAMFVAEAHLAIRLAHPNLVHVYELADDPAGGLLLSMEYVDGADLARILAEVKKRGDRLPAPVSLRVVEQAARGLHYAHEYRDDDGGEPLAIVHRDISPQNILVSKSGTVKVADLGVASARFVRDETGVQPGKLRYMSPEQARGEKVDRRCDVYALGVVLYEMLRLVSPYGDLRGNTLARAVRQGRIKPALPLLDDLPTDVVPVLRGALAPEPEDRTPTARDFADAIAHVLFERRAHVDEAAIQAALAPYLEAAAEAAGAGSSSTAPPPPTSGSSPSDTPLSDAPPSERPSGTETIPPGGAHDRGFDLGLGASLAPGDVFDRYVIEGPIGQGGMAEVFRARDTRLGREVALKLLRAGTGGVSRERMLLEARAAATFEHPGSVVVYDVGEHDGRPFIAMELVRGRGLSDFLGDASIPIPQRLRWSLAVARVLAAAHRRGLVHRDVKPSNVMIRDDGEVKVLDFGIVRLRAAEVDVPGAPALTADGAIVGTPGYAAPEQLLGDAVDERADQFAWAVTTYELLAGRRPWTGDTTGDVMAGTLFRPFEPLLSVAPDVPEPVAAAIERALARDPEARFPSIDEAAEALVPFCGADPGGARGSMPSIPSIAPPEESGARPLPPREPGVAPSGPPSPSAIATPLPSGASASSTATPLPSGASASSTATPLPSGASASSTATPLPSGASPPGAAASASAAPSASAAQSAPGPSAPPPASVAAPSVAPPARGSVWWRVAALIGAAVLGGAVAAYVMHLPGGEPAPAPSPPLADAPPARPVVASLRCAPAVIDAEGADADPEIARALGVGACARLAVELGVRWSDAAAPHALAVRARLGADGTRVDLEVAGARAGATAREPLRAVELAVAALAPKLAAPPLTPQQIQAWGAKDEAGARRIARVFRRRDLRISADIGAEALRLLDTDPDSPFSHLLVLMISAGSSEVLAHARERTLERLDRLPPPRRDLVRGLLSMFPVEIDRKEAARLIRKSYAEAPDDLEMVGLYVVIALRMGLPEAYAVLDRLLATDPTVCVVALDNAISRAPDDDLARDLRYATRWVEILPENRASGPVVQTYLRAGKLEEARASLDLGRRLGLPSMGEPLAYEGAMLDVDLAELDLARAREQTRTLLADPRPYTRNQAAHAGVTLHFLEGRAGEALGSLAEGSKLGLDTGDATGTARLFVRWLAAARWLGRRGAAPAHLDWLERAASAPDQLMRAVRAEALVELALARTDVGADRARAAALEAIEAEARAAADDALVRDELLVQTVPLVRELRGDRAAADVFRAAARARPIARLRPAIDAALAFEALGDAGSADRALAVVRHPAVVRESGLERVIAAVRLRKLRPPGAPPPPGGAREVDLGRLGVTADTGFLDQIRNMR